jgi:coenzyme F420 biosynthesis associated uncharacterized protein
VSDGDDRARDPVDWGAARRVGRLVAGRVPIAESYLGTSLVADFRDVTREAEEIVTDYTGLRADGGARAEVLDRAGWVDVNVESMQRLLAPLVERIGKRLERRGVMGGVARAATAAEMGALLGFLSQRVLGQYDLLVPDPVGAAPTDAAGSGDVVYFVGPNILTIEKRFAFRPRDFRLWIAIHEVTHRAQFSGVTWLRDYYLSLVERALTLVEPDPWVVVRALTNAADELRHGRNPFDQGGIIGLVATPEQRGVLAQVQALMSLLEGHGNVVMSELGRRHVVGEERMARVLAARRRRGGATGHLHRVLGFEAKMRQYEVGEQFVRGVIREAGPTGLDAAWRGPEWLPTVEELAAPTAWLARADARVLRGAAGGE